LCDECDGTGADENGLLVTGCQSCSGSGVQKWTLMNLPDPIGGVTNTHAD
jgi:DnaJ-class molecular chaperone